MKKQKLIMSCLVALGIFSASLSFADEKVDEKVYAPKVPESGSTPGQSVPSGEPPVTIIPKTPDGRVTSPGGGGGGVVVVPVLPDQKRPDYTVPQTPEGSVPEVVIPGQRDPDGVSPAKIGKPPETPVLPKVPDLPDRVIVLPEQRPDAKEPVKEVPQTPERPETIVAPQTKNGTTVLTPADFLPKTEDPQKKDKQAEAPPEKKEPQAAKPPEKQAEKKEKPRKGEPLKIPPDAARTGSMDFLEGCWVGTRPEYSSKRIITERFCFDKNGKGKRFILDPKSAGECVGATQAVVNSGGVLQMRSEEMFCSKGVKWGASEMLCKGEGQQTPCSWVFKDIRGKPSQSYSIRFVRE
ncbi:MAG: hypothetical protein LBS65_10035 [Desulfovibrio sp.]|nr:hypothetical protein [Desulfovibrio sp.]